MLLGLPLLGVYLNGLPISKFLEFPPKTRYVQHAAFSWTAFALYTGFILTCIIPLIVKGVRNSSNPKQRLPQTRSFPWWGWLGILTGIASWHGFTLNLLTTVILPVSFSLLALMVVRHWLPRHFFIYVYLNAFLAGGLSIVLSSLAASLLLSSATVVSFAVLWDTYLGYFPLMFFPEAVLNGWFMTLLVGYKPQWVSTFRDEDYLHGK